MAGKKRRAEKTPEGALVGFTKEQMAKLVELRGLLLDRLLEKFRSGGKVPALDTTAAVTMLRRAKLMEEQEDPDAPPAPPDTPQDGPGTAQDAPGSIEEAKATTDRPVAEGQKDRWLPFPARGE